MVMVGCQLWIPGTGMIVFLHDGTATCEGRPISKIEADGYRAMIASYEVAAVCPFADFEK